MKVLSWNCNMAFRKKTDIFNTCPCDIAIISECESKESILKDSHTSIQDIIWYGRNKHKGIGIMSFNWYKIRLLCNEIPFKYIIPIEISKNDTTILLLWVWTQMVENQLYKSYVSQAANAFLHYKNIFSSYKNIIISGDFNSSAIWDNDAKKEYNHSQMVKILNDMQISSVYHKVNNLDHGKETEATLYFRKNKKSPFHIDYTFLSENLLKNINNFSIWEYEKYISLSDHMPIFTDFEL